MHLAEYLFRRLHQIDIRAVFGVPGDFNLQALDYLEDCGLDWIGNVNELNAGYAADGYARVKGISAIVTTFGVGELSALNALAGATAELVPVIHIVGFPSTTAKKNKLPIHHTLGNGDYDVFMEMSARISSAVAILDNPAKAPKLIDDTIIECYRSSKPVYIGLPMDLVGKDVDSSSLAQTLALEKSPSDLAADQDIVINKILERLQTAQNPMIVIDSLAGRYQNLHSTRAFVEKSNLPCFVFPMAKGIVNEDIPNFRGIFSGNVSVPGALEQLHSSDLVLLIGSRPTDINTAGFRSDLSSIETISLQRNSVRLENREFQGICLNSVLERLSDASFLIRSNSISSSSGNEHSPQNSSLGTPQSPGTPPDLNMEETVQKLLGNRLKSSHAITHDFLWERMSSWLEEDDILSLDLGTAAFGPLWSQYPRGATSLVQLLWCSIGFALGAAVGAAIAVREQEQETKPLRKKRTILFTGDGSLQMTAQELSTMIRQKLGVIIFVICNEGYTIERYVHGWDKSYNDIQTWDYQLLPQVFNPEPGTLRTFSVRTKAELEMVLSDFQFGPADNFDKDPPLRLVEIHVDKYDAPDSLKRMINEIKNPN
ncbi:Thiamine pyrophosphate enzyme C-terminal TPP-binding [Penicillium macrosclerotiorum]|uniref:Thiamine pyrophosphate enzyme C-terminal TPP-binding n=1 Tax=Penicillium macrosclerotiorum TaxID=303699 RepID=UPI0025491176|nr:Thiamine pyrophosphate enzyme C-terminal TPP-binding [Penicillium macrosclerotiorum]KAJ5682831.1 Thiamine pyrophosphate enzyme C-terminal TPP-binding [Penicillium macrosclerotiorum]